MTSNIIARSHSLVRILCGAVSVTGCLQLMEILCSFVNPPEGNFQVGALTAQS